MSRHAFFWVLIVVAFVVGSALALASAQLVRLSRDAAMARQDVVVTELTRRLDGRAASAQMLELEADGALPSLPADLVAAVIDQWGSILASSSSSSGRWDGEPAPARWLDDNGMVRTGHWAASAHGAVIAGAPLHDHQGNLIGALIVEDSGTAVPLLARILMPAALWGLLLLVALLPACWFGVRLAVNPLARDAGAATAMLTALNIPGVASGEEPSGLAPVSQCVFAAFSRSSRRLLDQFDAAVEAVSLSGDADGVGGDMPPRDVTAVPGVPANTPSPGPFGQSMATGMRHAVRGLLLLGAGIALCVWGAIAIALVSAEQGRLADMRRLFAEAVADVVVRATNGATVLSSDQAEAVARDAGQMPGVSGIEILRPGRQIAASTPPQAAKVVRVVRPLVPGQPDGWRVAVMVEDSTDRDLAAVLGALLAGLVVGGWTGMELLLWTVANKVAAPLDMLERLAAAGAAGDYRRAPAAGGTGEVGELRLAMARFIGFLTLRAREVELLLRDARLDTYDPGVVARAEAWARRLQDQVRLAELDPSRAEMPDDPALCRWLWYLAVLLLGVQIPALDGSFTLAMVLAALLAGGRILAPIPRWLGRRAAIGAAGVSAALAVWMIYPTDPTLAAIVIALAAACIIHSSGAGQTGPNGRRGVAGDAGGLAAAAAGLGSAAVLTLTAGPQLLRLAPILLPSGILAIAAFAVAVRNPALEQPPRTVFPTIAEFLGALRNGPAAVTLIGLVLPAAAFVSAVMIAALAQGVSEGGVAAPCLPAAAAGLWVAPAIAAWAADVRWLPTIVRMLPGPALLALTSALPPFCLFPIAAVAGLLAGMLWHFAAVALYQTAQRERAAMPEQAVLLSAGIWRGIGFILPVAVLALGIVPVGAILALGVASALGGAAVLPRRAADVPNRTDVVPRGVVVPGRASAR